jgi:hypothetical protein
MQRGVEARRCLGPHLSPSGMSWQITTGCHPVHGYGLPAREFRRDALTDLTRRATIPNHGNESSSQSFHGGGGGGTRLCGHRRGPPPFPAQDFARAGMGRSRPWARGPGKSPTRCLCSANTERLPCPRPRLKDRPQCGRSVEHGSAPCPTARSGRHAHAQALGQLRAVVSTAAIINRR